MKLTAGAFLIVAFTLAGCQHTVGSKDFTSLAPGPFRAVYLIPDVDSHFARLELIVNAGEVDNTGPEGLAHYVEHLAWLPQLGTSGSKTSRHTNAWTNSKATGYFITGPRADLSANLTRLVRVAEPLSLPDKFMEEERDIVQREYDLRVVENPYHAANRAIAKRLYGDGPLAHSVIGTPESIATFSIDLARRFHELTHPLSNMVLIADGGVAVEELEKEISQIPVGKPTELMTLPAPPDQPLREQLQKTVSQLSADVLLYAKSVALPESIPDTQLIVAVDILDNLLDSALPGGIAGPLRFDTFIAQSFEFGLYLHSNSHLEMRFNARPDKGVSVTQLQQAFESVLRENAKVGLPKSSVEKTISRYRNQLSAVKNVPAMTRSLVRTQQMNRRAPLGYSDIVKASESITYNDINELFNVLMGDSRVVAMHLLSDTEK